MAAATYLMIVWMLLLVVFVVIGLAAYLAARAVLRSFDAAPEALPAAALEKAGYRANVAALDGLIAARRTAIADERMRELIRRQERLRMPALRVARQIPGETA